MVVPAKAVADALGERGHERGAVHAGHLDIVPVVTVARSLLLFALAALGLRVEDWCATRDMAMVFGCWVP